MALPFASILLARRWDDEPFRNWDQDFIEKVLTDSPWARTWKGYAIQPESDQRMTSSWAQIGTGLPRIPGVGWPRSPGPVGLPRTGDPDGALRVAVELTVRWASALPVRQAMTLVEFGRDRLDDPRAIEILAPPPDFRIELAGLPYRLVNAEFERDLGKASLIVRGHRALLPSSVEVASVGAHATAILKFSRIADISPDAGNIDVRIQAGSLRIEESFKLRQMVYQGRLEL